MTLSNMFNYLDIENNYLVDIYNCDRCWKIFECVSRLFREVERKNKR